METAGVEPAPPRCKRGAHPHELHPQRVSADGWSRTTTACVCSWATGLQPGELAGTQRPHEEGGRPGSNRRRAGHDRECLPLHHDHHETGTTGFEPAASRLTSECSAHLSYAPNEVAPAGVEPASRAHEARGTAVSPRRIWPAGVEPAVSGSRNRRDAPSSLQPEVQAENLSRRRHVRRRSDFAPYAPIRMRPPRSREWKAERSGADEASDKQHPRRDSNPRFRAENPASQPLDHGGMQHSSRRSWNRTRPCSVSASRAATDTDLRSSGGRSRTCVSR